jgi:NAD(P)-dependent dehydrogenase (short-subunit alcohol dehydrogenase family)
MSGRFAGQRAVVTGGAGGIGAAVARRLAGEGADVLVADLDGRGAAKVAAEFGGVAAELTSPTRRPSRTSSAARRSTSSSTARASMTSAGSPK